MYNNFNLDYTYENQILSIITLKIISNKIIIFNPNYNEILISFISIVLFIRFFSRN